MHLYRKQLIEPFISAYQYALSQWKDHLRRANPRRLLNYAHVINVRSGHEPICTHENKCHILCEINGITRCIEVTAITQTDIFVFNAEQILRAG